MSDSSLRVYRERRQTLKTYTQEHGLSVNALHFAHSALKRRGVLTDPAPAAPPFVPVRIPTANAAFRVHLPICPTASSSRSRLMP